MTTTAAGTTASGTASPATTGTDTGATTAAAQTTDTGATATTQAGTHLTTPAAVDPNDWRTSLPDDLRGEPTIKDIKSVADLVKSHKNAQSLVGAKGIIVPKPDAPQSEKDAFFNQLGRPETTEGYKLPDIKLPPGLNINDGVKSAVIKKAHELGLNQEQLSGMFQVYLENQSNAFTQHHESQARDMEVAVEGLRREWGADFDPNLNLAKIAVKHFGQDGLEQWLEQTGMGNNPLFIKFFSRIGKSVSEETLMGRVRDQGMGMSPEQAKHKISELEADPEFMKKLQDRDAVGHKSAVEERSRLFDIAYKNEKQQN